jgi:bifunctional enzyme CysN/CysC
LVTIVALVSPYAEDRSQAKALFPSGDFVEVWIKTSAEICEQRDPKGLYKKAAAGELPNLTGIGQEYETPLAPELVLDGTLGVEENIELLLGKFFT